MECSSSACRNRILKSSNWILSISFSSSALLFADSRAANNSCLAVNSAFCVADWSSLSLETISFFLSLNSLEKKIIYINNYYNWKLVFWILKNFTFFKIPASLKDISSILNLFKKQRNIIYMFRFIRTQLPNMLSRQLALS